MKYFAVLTANFAGANPVCKENKKKYGDVHIEISKMCYDATKSYMDSIIKKRTRHYGDCFKQ